MDENKQENKLINRNRAGSIGSLLDDLTKRKRDAETSPSASDIFRRSKKTARSPVKPIETGDKLNIRLSDEERKMEEILNKLDEMSKKQVLDAERQSKETEELKELIRKNNLEFKEEIRKCDEKWEKERKELETQITRLEARVQELEQGKSESSQRQDVPTPTPTSTPGFKAQANKRDERRKNIVIEGLETKEWNHATDVQKFLKEKMEVDAVVTDAFPLRTKNAKKKLILAKMLREEDKRKIMQVKKDKLTGTGIFINDDLSKEERETQKKLREKAKIERAAGRNVRIGHGKIFIDGNWFKATGELIQDKIVDLTEQAADSEQ